MRVQQKRRIRYWMGYLVLASTTLATTGCAGLYHLTHYNAVTEAINEHKRPYYHSSHTGRIIAKEHGDYCPVEPACYGYEPTCWQAWPSDCPNCPPPDRVLSDEVLPESSHQTDAAADPEPMPATSVDPPQQQNATEAKDGAGKDDPPSKQGLPEDIERILDEPLPPAGDEEPIIPQGSMDRQKSFDLVGVKANSLLPPRPVTALIAPEPMTRLPSPEIHRQVKVGSLIAKDSLLNNANQSAVELWESQEKTQAVAKKSQSVQRQRRPADVNTPKPIIAFSGAVEKTRLSPEEASPQRFVMQASQRLASPRTASTPKPVLSQKPVQPQKPVLSQKSELPQRQPAAKVDALETQQAKSLPPVRLRLTSESSRRRTPTRFSAQGTATSAKPVEKRESFKAQQRSDRSQDAEVPTFRISTAKQSKRAIPGKKRVLPAGEPKRLIRFISDEEIETSNDVETATVPAGPSTLKFR